MEGNDAKRRDAKRRDAWLQRAVFRHITSVGTVVIDVYLIVNWIVNKLNPSKMSVLQKIAEIETEMVRVTLFAIRVD